LVERAGWTDELYRHFPRYCPLGHWLIPIHAARVTPIAARSHSWVNAAANPPHVSSSCRRRQAAGDAVGSRGPRLHATTLALADTTQIGSHAVIGRSARLSFSWPPSVAELREHRRVLLLIGV
jgi:hypothetical protein